MICIARIIFTWNFLEKIRRYHVIRVSDVQFADYLRFFGIQSSARQHLKSIPCRTCHCKRRKGRLVATMFAYNLIIKCVVKIAVTESVRRRYIP